METIKVLITTDGGKILRNRMVSSLDEVATLHRELPRYFLGAFAGDVMWLWVPEVKDWF